LKALFSLVFSRMREITHDARKDTDGKIFSGIDFLLKVVFFCFFFEGGSALFQTTLVCGRDLVNCEIETTLPFVGLKRHS